jgi:hypothetical protein
MGRFVEPEGWSAEREGGSTSPVVLRSRSEPMQYRVTSDLETSMAVESPTPPPIFRYGRLAFWLVLALMLLSVVYAGWHVVANWVTITV